MDSGTSGSLQSSSGGGGGDDQEYDSRAETSPLSAFFNTNPPPQPPSHHHHHHHSSMFDPLSNYFNPLSSPAPPPPPPASQQPQLNNTNSNSSFLNFDMIWSKSLRSDPNCTDLTSLIPNSSPSSSSNPSTQHLLSTFPPSPFHINNSHHTTPNTNNSNTTMATNTNNSNTNTGVVRNPKKRSRASRRAPTTVLTTDTTNFRAMVQEFTGIPAPPFTSSSSALFPRTRLDLFGTPSSALRSSSTANNHPLFNSSPTPPPPYLLRPFAQKMINPPPFLSSSTTTTTTTNAATSNTNSNTTSVNFQLQPSDLHHHNQNLLNINMQNQVLNLQSLLQASSTNKYPFSNSSPNIKPQGPPLDHIPSSNDHHHQSHHLKIGVLEELGLSHGGGLQNIESVQLDPTTLPMRGTENINNSTNWVPANDGSGSNENHDQGKVSNLLSASSSEFHGGKGQENAGLITRNSEGGMLESWICSSD